jgi:hypothetical protein
MEGVDRARSGDGGRFELLHVPSGTYAIEARATMALRAVSRYGQGPNGLTIDFAVDGETAPPEQRIEVEACGAVRGRAVGADPLDLSAFQVNIQVGSDSLAGAADDFGTFEFPQVPAGQGLVVSSWSPQAASEPFDVVEGRVTDVELDLAGQGGIAGVVRDEAGQPVADATIRIVPEQNLPVIEYQQAVARTDAQGRFLALVADWQRQSNPGRWAVGASHPDYAFAMSELLGLPAKGATAETALVLRAGGTISGVVEYEGGGPAPGANVHARPKPASKEDVRGARGGTADLSGRFELKGLSPGEYSVMASLPDLLAQVEAAPGATGLRLVLKPFHSIRGVVIDDRGRPVTQGAIVALVGERKQTGSIGTGGRFQVSGLEPGSYVLEVSPGNRNPWQPSLRFETTRTAPFPTGTEDAVVVVSSGASLRGRVVGPGGRPVPGAGVVAIPLRVDPKDVGKAMQAVHPRAIASAKGEFVIEGLFGEEVELLAWAPGYQPATAPAPPGSANVQVTLSEGEVIEGRILRPDGTPFQGQYVSVYPSDAPMQAKLQDWQTRGGQSWNAVGGWRLLSAQTDGGGAFRLRGLPAGAYDLNLQAGDAVAPPTRLQTGGGSVTVRLEQGFAVTGRVTDRRGQPVPPEIVWISANSGGRWVGSTRPDATGRFELRGVPAGPVTIHAYAGNNRYRPGSVQAVGGDRDVTLVLEDA